MSEDKQSPGSTAAHPDLDWSQVKETVLLLKLAAAQVEFSLKDGTQSVDVLTDSFTNMAVEVHAIGLALDSLSEKYGLDQSEVKQHCDQISEKMQQAIIAFQFYDTLVQRLDHVVNSLSGLGDLVADSSRLYSPQEWQALQEKIRSRYTMEKERELFDAVVAGEDMEQVLQRMHDVATSDQDSIELF